MSDEIVYKEFNENIIEINAMGELLQKCFPESNKFTSEYLKWLYFDNPAGNAVGFNAYSGDKLIGHYSCVPFYAQVGSEKQLGLLSLNTATDPKFQGKGLFKKLANKTYVLAKELGYKFVCGVANYRSTKLFTKLLRFNLVGSLDVKIGFGDYFKYITSEGLNNDCEFYPIWNEEALRWRVNNPYNKSSYVSKNGDIEKFTSPTQYGILLNYACCYNSDALSITHKKLSLAQRIKPRLMLSLTPYNVGFGYVSIPEKLKPSPLNFIFKSLNDEEVPLSKDNVLFTYMDFDAY